jgi:hypothetical protein
VLGAVVLEDAPQVLQPRQQDEVAEEDRDPDDLLDDHEDDRVGQRVAEDARDAHRQQEEEPDRQRQRERDGARPGAAGDLLLVLRKLRVGGDPERLEADRQRLDEGDDPADDGQAQQPVPLEHRRQREGPDLDVPERSLQRVEAALAHLLGQRLAHGDRPRRDAAHHDALEHRLAAHGGVALRLERRRRPGVGHLGHVGPVRH